MKQARVLLPNARLKFAMSLGVMAVLALSACAMQHDTGDAVTLRKEADIALDSSVIQSPKAWPDSNWWTRYGDDQLNKLEAQALANSPMIAVAKARVKASYAQSSLVQSTTGLFVGMTASIDREEVSSKGFLFPFAMNEPHSNFTGPWYTEGTVGLEAHYDLDLWGKDKARVAAAIGAQNARTAEAEYAKLVLSTRVAQVYFDIQSLYALLDLLTQSRAIEQEMVAAHDARAARGLESKTPGQLSRTHLLEIDHQITVARSAVQVQQESLRALLGAGPGDMATITPNPLPHEVGQLPTELGYELLARRADLQAMHWYLEASDRQIDAAKAAFYPSFDIKAFFGQDALHLQDLWLKSSRQINLIPGLSLPLFDSGRLNAQLATANARKNELITEYNQAIVDAVRQVAQEGIQLQSLNEQVKIENERLDALSFAQRSVDAHYTRGLANRVSAMEARLPVLAIQGKLIELHSQQLTHEIGLTMALGGGYQAPPAGEAQKAGS